MFHTNWTDSSQNLLTDSCNYTKFDWDHWKLFLIIRNVEKQMLSKEDMKETIGSLT